jgi:hypothetical protein
MRVLGVAADDRADVVRVVPGQVAAVQQDGARAEVGKPEQDRGHCGLPRAGGADERDPASRCRVKIYIPNGRRCVR